MKKEINYYALFVLGLSLFGAGIALDMIGLYGIGIVFAIAGLANRKKWKIKKFSQLSKEEKRNQLIIIGVGILVLAAILIFALLT